jgi:hypothetical protein
MNTNSALSDISKSNTITGYALDSWKFLNTMAAKVYDGEEKEFGYFVYTPDIIAYAPKYALLYNGRLNKDKQAHYFQKKPVTYIVVAPPAESNPFLSYDWWKKERLRLDAKPVLIHKFENGYRIEKYHLDSEQIGIPFDPGIDPGLSFR